MDYTCQSETGSIRSLFIKKSTDAFISDEHLNLEWKKLNYLEKPLFEKAAGEYSLFESALKQKVPEIHCLPADGEVNMDSIYCRDASIATDKGMIICRMGKEDRKNEPAAQKKVFESRHIPVLGEIIFPGTAEGGDALWLDETTLAIGYTYRTNLEGIGQIRKLLEPAGIEIVQVDLPHYKGPSDVFHLMSIISPVDRDLALVFSPLMPIAFRKLLLKRGYRLIETPEAEFESMGCNVLAMGPRDCLAAAGNPLTKAALEKEGCRVTIYHGEEISLKGGGGPTCLTRPIRRNR